MSSLMTHPELFRDMLCSCTSHTLQRAARKASTEAELCSAASGASRAFVAGRSTISAVDQAKAILVGANRAVVVIHTWVALAAVLIGSPSHFREPPRNKHHAQFACAKHCAACVTAWACCAACMHAPRVLLSACAQNVARNYIGVHAWQDACMQVRV